MFYLTFSAQNATNDTDKDDKFVFGQNMSERVLVSSCFCKIQVILIHY